VAVVVEPTSTGGEQISLNSGRLSAHQHAYSTARCCGEGAWRNLPTAKKPACGGSNWKSPLITSVAGESEQDGQKMNVS